MQESIIVTSIKEGGERLDIFLKENLEDFTRSQIKRQIDSKNATVNGSVKKAGYMLKKGDVISISFSKEAGLEDVLPEDIDIDIIYEDEDIAVINKAQGMVVHPAPGNYTHTLVNALLFHFNTLSEKGSIRPGIVHRIDKDTSGLLVIAKNEKAHANLAYQIAEHSARRTYVALLEGNLKSDEGTVTTYLDRDKRDRKKYAVSDEGKLAITHYRVLQRYQDYTLCEFVLETGRTHQIRVHAKYLNHPIVGDKVYGFAKQKFKLEGQLLHAKNLKFVHPRTGEHMSFSSPLPAYFENTLKKLKNC